MMMAKGNLISEGFFFKSLKKANQIFEGFLISALASKMGQIKKKNMANYHAN